MTVNLEEVQNLLLKLTKLMQEEANALTRKDRMAMQHLYNIEYYLSSNINYNASYNITSLKVIMVKCSEEVQELLSPLLNRY